MRNLLGDLAFNIACRLQRKAENMSDKARSDSYARRSWFWHDVSVWISGLDTWERLTVRRRLAFDGVRA